MEQQLLIDRIAVAKSEIAEAESALDTLLETTKGTPRAEKTTITKVVEDAFRRLRAAKGTLDELEQLVVARDT